LEDVDEELSDRLALQFGLGDAGKLAKKLLRCINMHKRDVVVMPEQIDHRFGLIQPEQAVIDEDASELVADRFMDQHGGDGGIDPAGEAADHAPIADLSADFL